MRKLCLFAVHVVLTAAIVAAAQAQNVKTSCVTLGYFDANDQLVSSPLLAGPPVHGVASSPFGWRFHPL
jgi:hypothetical protein